jgi:hypothetical protein
VAPLAPDQLPRECGCASEHNQPTDDNPNAQRFWEDSGHTFRYLTVDALAAAADPPQVDHVPRAVALTRLERPVGRGAGLPLQGANQRGAFRRRKTAAEQNWQWDSYKRWLARCERSGSCRGRLHVPYELGEKGDGLALVHNQAQKDALQ